MAIEAVLVIPCFNEAKRWDAERFQTLAELPGLQLLFVDDGSTDTTGALLSRFCSNGTSSLLTQPFNGGKAEAVRAGLLASLAGTSHTTLVGFLDADGAFAVADVHRMLELARTKVDIGFDALWSSRVALSGRSIHRRPSRHYIGRGVATALSVAYPHLPYDSQSGFKLFGASPTLRMALMKPFRTRWIFEVELLLRWQQITGKSMRIWEEPVLAWRDVPGSKIRGMESLRISREIASVIRLSRQGNA